MDDLKLAPAPARNAKDILENRENPRFLRVIPMRGLLDASVNYAKKLSEFVEFGQQSSPTLRVRGWNRGRALRRLFVTKRIDDLCHACRGFFAKRACLLQQPLVSSGEKSDWNKEECAEPKRSLS